MQNQGSAPPPQSHHHQTSLSQHQKPYSATQNQNPSSSTLSSQSPSSSSSLSPPPTPNPHIPDPTRFSSRVTTASSMTTTTKPPLSPPSIAYLKSGSRGDSGRVLRLLIASYHPLNHYLLHLDPSAPVADRENLALTVQGHPVFKAARNVHVMGKPDFSYPKGSSPVSMTLHGASILMRLKVKWDWFVSLSADAYPLVTQDEVEREMGFVSKCVCWWDENVLC